MGMSALDMVFWIALFALGTVVVELYFRGHEIAYVLIFLLVFTLAQVYRRTDQGETTEVDDA